MAANPRIRTRTVIAAVGAAFVTAVVRNAPLRGVIRRVRATVAIATDPQAVQGGGVLDLGLEVREATTGVGLGGPNQTAAPLVYDLTPLDPQVTIDSQEEAGYRILPGNNLTVAVRTDAAGPSTVVVTLEIEPIDEGR